MKIIRKPDINAVYKAYILFLSIIIAASVIFLIPAYSGLAVFAKGEFAFVESLAFFMIYLIFISVALIIAFTKFAAFKIKSHVVNKAIYLIFWSAGISATLVVISFIWIRHDVKRICQDAKRQYGGGCVEALNNLITDDRQSFHNKNNAVYALGQLADKSALPVLKQYFTGNIPDRESLYSALSQYELEKAIRWCERGNMTSWMYWDSDRWR